MFHQQIKGLVTLVTGGGSGLGLATWKRLALLGARVVTLDLTPPKDEPTFKNVIHLKGDIRNDGDIKNAIECCKSEDNQHKLDVVVNCAGVANAFTIYNFKEKKAQRLSDFQDLVDINIGGTFNVIRLSVESLIKNELNAGGCRGVIINTSSILANEGHEGQVGYAATQGAINSMTLPIARDLAEKGIRCNTIACGFFKTPLVTRADSSVLIDFITYATPCPSRLGDPDEFAALVQSIIENQMINGEIIRIDGAIRWPERG